jgi:CheY-like chemotaxis protein
LNERFKISGGLPIIILTGYPSVRSAVACIELPVSAYLVKPVAIDEIQHRSDLFPILRVLADRKPLPARFLILGSASPELLHQSSESLAGRLETIPVTGLGLAEVGTKALSRHWLRGGFPLSFLARTNEDSASWRRQFIRTFLERDVPQLGINIPAGLDHEGLPIGVQLYGNFAREDLLLQLAAQVERARPEWFGAVPPVHVTKSD